jgi:hypothetical protein
MSPAAGRVFASQAAGALAALLVTWAGVLPACAADAPGSAALLFREADLAVGAKLIREHKCSECHARKFGGDGAAIYRPQGRINTPAALRGMVEQCNLELNLAFFPDEVTSISAVLNREHYRFK